MHFNVHYHLITLSTLVFAMYCYCHSKILYIIFIIYCYFIGLRYELDLICPGTCPEAGSEIQSC